MLIDRVVLFISGLFFVLISTQAAAAPPPPQFIQFSPNTTKGALYYPDPALFPSPHVAMIAIHRDNSDMSHSMTTEMPARGIVAMGMSTRCENNEAKCTPWEANALDLKQAIEYLRKLPGITRVVLMGPSGGGPTVSFYQAVAEAGIDFCQQPQKLVKCPDELAGLPKVDGLVLWDGHPGNGLGVMRSLNPAVVNDAEIINQNADPKIDPALDPLNPANGYKPEGSTYSAAFKEKFFKAQAARMNRLIDLALEKLKRIEAGSYRYPDDDTFVVPAGAGTRLANHDASIDHTTTRPQRLLRNDGSIEDCCVIESVRDVGQSPETSRSYSGALLQTVRSFLSVNAMRGAHSMTDIDWCSTNNSTPCNLAEVSVPVLIVAMTGHYFIRDAEINYDWASSKDKEYIAIEGATHGGSPCRDCIPAGQKYDGRYDNSQKNGYDYVAKWINARF